MPAGRPALVIAAGCGIALLAFGLRSSFGLFLEPLGGARGWGREVFAFAIAVQHLVWGLGQPFAGAIADRVGAGRVLVAGGLLYATGIALMSISTSPAALTLTAGLLVGLGLSGASFTIVLAAIGRIAPPHRRSQAFGLGTAAGSMGQFLLVPTGQAAMAAFGWQGALLVLAALALLIVPLAVPLAGAPAEPTGGDAPQTLRQALARAAVHPSYWYLTSGFFVCGFHVAFIQTHLPAYLRDLGLPQGVAAWALGLIGLFNIAGAWGAGMLGARLSKRRLLSGLYLARSLLIAAFILAPPTPFTVLAFSAALGLLWLSTVPLTSGLVAVMFGTRWLGTLFGIVFLSHQLGAFVGAWLGGRWFDSSGNYDAMWWFSVALGLVAAALHWPIVERPVAAVPA